MGMMPPAEMWLETMKGLSEYWKTKTKTKTKQTKQSKTKPNQTNKKQKQKQKQQKQKQKQTNHFDHQRFKTPFLTKNRVWGSKRYP